MNKGIRGRQHLYLDLANEKTQGHKGGKKRKGSREGGGLGALRREKKGNDGD